MCKQDPCAPPSERTPLLSSAERGDGAAGSGAVDESRPLLPPDDASDADSETEVDLVVEFEESGGAPASGHAPAEDGGAGAAAAAPGGAGSCCHRDAADADSPPLDADSPLDAVCAAAPINADGEASE